MECSTALRKIKTFVQIMPDYMAMPNQWCDRKIRELVLTSLVHESYRVVQVAKRIVAVALLVFAKIVAYPLNSVGMVIKAVVSGPSPRLLFHVLANSFGANSKLEGATRIEILSPFNSFLKSQDKKNIPIPGLTPQLREMLAKAQSLESSWFYQSTLRSQIEAAFATQTRILIPAGWAGERSGHVMYWELIPTSPVEASLRLFNEGAGVENNASRQVGVKQKYQAGCEWQGINKEALLKPEFIRVVHELQTRARTVKGTFTSYGVHDVYGAIRELLKPKNVVPLDGDKEEIVPHEAGICAWKSLLAFLHTHLSLKDYKNVKCHFQKQLLIDSANNTPRPDEMTYRLIKKDAAKYCRSLNRLKMKGFITQLEMIEIKKSLKPVFAWIKQHKQILKLSQTLNISSRQPLSRGLLSIPPLTPFTPSKPMKTEGATLAGYCRQVDFNKDSFHDVFAKVQPLFEKGWEDGDDQTVNTGFIHLMKKMPVDSGTWASLAKNSPEEAKELIRLLGKTATPFFKSCFMVPHAVQFHPERFEAIKKIHYIQMLLLKNIEPDLAACFGVNKRTWNFSRLYEPNPNGNIARELTNPSSLHCWDTYNYQVFEKEKANNFPREKLLSLIGGADKVQRQFPEYNTLPHELFKNARIFLSEDLPEWFQAIRESEQQCIYLDQGYVATPSIFNRDTDLTFTRKIYDKMDDQNSLYCSISWNLKGISSELINDYPELRSLDRFQNLFRPLARPMSTIVDIIVKDYPPAEKELISNLTTLNTTSLMDEEFEELLHIVTNKDLQIIEALEYFNKHLDKLSDPDYQTFFKLIFFKKELLENALVKYDRLEKNLSCFLEKAFKNYQNQNNMQACTFLLQMSRYTSSFCQQKKDFYHSPKEIRSLLQKEALLPEDKSFLYSEFIASFCREKTIEKVDAEEILKAYKFLYQYNVPKKWEDPEIQKEIRETLAIHQDIIQAVLGPNKTIENYIIEDESKAPIPSRIRENFYFKALFPDIKVAAKSKEGQYTFVDSCGFSTRVFLNQDNVCIERQLKGEWHRLIFQGYLEQMSDQSLWEKILALTGYYQPEERVVTALTSRHLVNDYHHWLSSDSSTVLITDKNSGALLYKGSIDPWSHQVSSIVKCKDGTKLGASSTLFTHFEDPSYIEEWYDPTTDMLKAVDLPRYGLSFKMDMATSQLVPDQYPGYHLKLNKAVPYLGTFPHYLLLENDQGEQKVIFPDNKFIPLKEKEVLRPSFNRDLGLALGDHSKYDYATYSIEKNGTFKADKRSEIFYLAEVLTIAQEYASAASLLKKHGDKSTLFSNEEQMKLHSIATSLHPTGDKDPNAFALRTYAGFLLTKNSLLKGNALDKQNLELLGENYTHYLKKIHNVTELKLSVEEELFILRIMVKGNYYNPALAVRLKELSPTESFVPPVAKKSPVNPLPSTRISFSDLELSLKDAESWYSLNFKEIVERTWINFFSFGWKSYSLISRPQEILQHHFVYFFQVATKGTNEQKEQLSYALTFLKHSQNQRDRSLHLFYETILAAPASAFPPFPNESGEWSKENTYWQWKVLKIAEELAVQSQQQKTEAPTLDFKDHPINENISTPAPMQLSFILSPFNSFASLCKKFFSGSEVGEDPSLDQLEMLLKEHQDGPDKREIVRLQNDLKAHSQQNKKVFSLKDGGLLGIQEMAKEGLDNEAQEIEKLGVEIVNLANAKHLAPFERSEHRLLKEGEIQKPLTIEDVLVSFGRRDPLVLQVRNGALTQIQINTLHEKAGSYLLKATHQQQRQRVLKKTAEFALAKGEKEVHTLTQELVGELRERAYDYNKSPENLVFEYYANILIRQDQIEKLAEFFKTGNNSLVIRLIKEIDMGDGKSKVLLPLLALLRANGVDLSLVVATTDLAESVLNDSREILGAAFAQRMLTIHFDRNTECSVPMLQCLLDDLQATIRNKDCLLMTSKSIGCLALKFIEMMILHYKEGGKEYSKEVQLMKQILNLVRQQGCPLLDEVDTILNILLEVCFSIGETHNPSLIDIEVIVLIYSIVYGDEELQNLVLLESNPAANRKEDLLLNTKKPPLPLNEKNYETVLKKPLAKKVWAKLKNHEKLKDFSKKLTKDEENLVLDYLLRSEGVEEKVQKFYDNISDDTVKDMLALAGEHISHLLPHTLTRECDKNYGVDPFGNSLLAIPFRGANAPSKGSQFASHHIEIDYTIQSNVKNPIPAEALKKEIERLQELAMKELVEESDLHKTKAWQTYLFIKKDLNVPLFNLNGVQLEKLHTQLNANVENKITFIEKVVLPRMKISEQKISWNPQNFSAFFESYLKGFTGTLWNSESMHPSLSPGAEIGKDMKTLTILWKQSRDAVFVLKEGTEDDFLDQMNVIGYHAIIDAAGNIKTGGNEAIAKKISLSKKRPVVFYSTIGEQMITDGSKTFALANSPWKEHEWDVFYDQQHCQGADVKVNDKGSKEDSNGIGIVTIKRKMLLRDLLQAVKRLRKLGLAHSVKFAMVPEVEGLIRQELSLKSHATIRFDHILLYTIRSQREQLDKDILKSIKQQMNNIPQMELFDQLLKQDTPLEKGKDLLDKLWIQPTNKPARELYGKIPVERDSKDILNEESVRCKKILENDLKLDSNHEAMKGIELVASRQNLLPEKIIDRAKSDEDQSLEIEQEVQKEEEKEMHEMPEAEQIKLGRLFTGFIAYFDDFENAKKSLLNDYPDLPVFSLSSYLKQDSDLKKYADAFKGIDLTYNVLNWADGSKGSEKLLGRWRTPFHHLKVTKKGIILCSNLESDRHANYNLSLGFIKNTQGVDEKKLKNIVKVKFLNGESHYTKEEIRFLEEWFKVIGMDNMKELFVKQILTGFPLKINRYNKSVLKQLFESSALKKPM